MAKYKKLDLNKEVNSILDRPEIANLIEETLTIQSERDQLLLSHRESLASTDSLVEDISNKKRWMIEFEHLATRKRVNFHGFVTQWGDSFQSDWNDEDVFGRMDPISIFKSTKRTMTLAWSIPAYSEEEAVLNTRRVNHFVQMLYPKYQPIDVGNVSMHVGKNGKTRKAPKRKVKQITNKRKQAITRNAGKSNYIVSPPLLRVRFANLIHNSETGQKSGVHKGGLVVKVNGNLGVEADLENGLFGTDPGMLYPKIWKLNCSFTVFHTHPLGFHNNVTFGSKKTVNNNFPYPVLSVKDPGEEG